MLPLVDGIGIHDFYVFEQCVAERHCIVVAEDDVWWFLVPYCGFFALLFVCSCDCRCGGCTVASTGAVLKWLWCGFVYWLAMLQCDCSVCGGD